MPDFTVLFQLLSFACALVVLHVMQQTWLDPASKSDGPFVQHVRRIGYVALICGLAWNVSYLDTKGVQANAPDFLIVLGIGLMFFVRSVVLFKHRNDMPSRQMDRIVRN